MNIFFAGSSTSLPDSKTLYKQIISYFEDLGHAVLPSWIVTILRNTDLYNQMSAKHVLEEQQSLVRKADLMVVECSKPSFGIGFLMHLALQERLPILCLIPSGSEITELSDMIRGNSSSLMHLREYDETTLQVVVSRFCDEYISDDLHKFNFIASREVLDFIETGAIETSKSKSEFLRDEITRIIRDKEK